MELSSFLTPASIAIVAIITLFFLLQLALDSIRAAHRRTFTKAVLERLKQSQTGKHTVVVQLRHNTHGLRDLLNHLDAQRYTKLETVILAEQAIHHETTKIIRQYRRTQPHMNIRVVKRNSNQDAQALFARYASGDFVTILDTTDRLVDGFFEKTALRFTDNTIDALSVRKQAPVNQSLGSALRALGLLQHDILAPLRPTRSDDAFVYRTERYVSSSVHNVSHSSASCVITQNSGCGYISPLTGLFFIAFGIAFIAGLTSTTEGAYIFAAPFIGYVLFLGSQVITTKSYRVKDRINLFLLLPLLPVIELALSLLHLLRLLTLPMQKRIFLR